MVLVKSARRAPCRFRDLISQLKINDKYKLADLEYI